MNSFPRRYHIAARILFSLTILVLSGVLSVTIVYAQEGDLPWAKAIMGGGGTEPTSIYVDSSGNVYTTGWFYGPADFDPGPETFNLTAANSYNQGLNYDWFISKLDSSGAFVWAKALGGVLDDDMSITVDSSGNVYITGHFEGTVDFDPGPETFNLTSTGGADIFISKLDDDGNFVWTKALGGTSDDVGGSIALDSSGNVYTSGRFQGTVDFDPGPETFNLTSTGSADGFISKLDNNGNFVWAKARGGVLNGSNSISVDSSGNVYTIGNFFGTADFAYGPETFNLTSAGITDIFISKLDSNGNLVWAKVIGGSLRETSVDMSFDSSGNVYTTGYFEGTVDFDPGSETFNLTSTRGSDMFISKLDSNGHFIWAKTIGGRVGVSSIAIDLTGYVYTTGSFSGTVDFDPGSGTFNLTSAGEYGDLFIHKLDSNGHFVWAKAMGANGSVVGGSSIALDSSGYVYTTGTFEGTVDFAPGPETSYLTSRGMYYDMFIVKLRNTDYRPTVLPMIYFLLR